MTDKVIFFLTASGILVAILLVWAQLWVTTAQEYKEAKGRNYYKILRWRLKSTDENLHLLTAGYGLSYVYWAISFSFVAFIVTIISCSINKLGIIFFGSAILLTSGIVIMSLVSAIGKTIMGHNLLAPPEVSFHSWKFKIFSMIYEPWARILISLVMPLVVVGLWVGLVNISFISNYLKNFLGA